MGGGGSTKSTTSDPQAQKTMKLQRENILQPLIATFMPQWLESLMTGRTSAQQLPMVQNAVSNTRSGTSSALTALKALIAGKGGTGTPFAAKSVNEATTQGDQEANSVAPNMALDWLRQIPGMITGTSGTFVNASGGNRSTSSRFNDGGAGLGQMMGQLGSTALLAYGINSKGNAAASTFPPGVYTPNNPFPWPGA